MNNNTFFGKPWVQSTAAIIVIFGLLAGFIYWQMTKNTVFIENSYLDAPISNISVTTPGSLNAVYVQEGQHVDANAQLALVGSETLYAKDPGTVSSAPKVLGSYFAPGQTVISIVADQQMRVVGTIDENKGLSSIVVGQRATFTVDAFSGKTYEGIVDEISPVSNDSEVVFSISDKRPVKNFNVYVRFDVSKYPELKSGMSAKITVDTK